MLTVIFALANLNLTLKRQTSWQPGQLQFARVSFVTGAVDSCYGALLAFALSLPAALSLSLLGALVTRSICTTNEGGAVTGTGPLWKSHQKCQLASGNHRKNYASRQKPKRVTVAAKKQQQTLTTAATATEAAAAASGR